MLKTDCNRYVYVILICWRWAVAVFQSTGCTKSPFTRPHLSSGSFWSDAGEFTWYAVAACPATSCVIERARVLPRPTDDWAARWYCDDNSNVKVNGVRHFTDFDKQCKSYVVSDWWLRGRFKEKGQLIGWFLITVPYLFWYIEKVPYWVKPVSTTRVHGPS